MRLNFMQRRIEWKVIFCAPPPATSIMTNLHYLHARASPVTRTPVKDVGASFEGVFAFDFVSDLPTERGLTHALSLHGRVDVRDGPRGHHTRRRFLFQDADALILVMDPSESMREKNLALLLDLEEEFEIFRVDRSTFPIAFQYLRDPHSYERDAEIDLVTVAHMDAAINPGGHPTFIADSRTGKGIQETLDAVLQLAFDRSPRFPTK